MTRHQLVNPDGMAPATGFSYGAVAAQGRLLHIAGLTGHHPDGSIDETIVEQFGHACRAVASVISDAGGVPEDLISMTIYTPVIEDYRTKMAEIGVKYRSVFGKHYPPMALLGIDELFDPRALVELVCVAVVPEVD